MLAIQPVDLQDLPSHAQQEIYDFYLFLKQRYSTEELRTKSVKNKQSQALEELLAMTAQNEFHVASSVDIRVLIDQTHNVELGT